MNDVKLLGRLTKDPDIRVLNNENQTKVAKYTLAVNRKNKQDGKQVADFFYCVCYGKLADFAQKHLKKGTQIIVDGNIQIGSYVDKDNKKVYTTDIIVEEHYFCGSNNNQSNTKETNSEKSENENKMYPIE